MCFPKDIRQNKYNAVKTTVDGVTFDSKKEASRYCELKLLERAGQVHCLELQVRYEICPKVNSLRARYYVADFTYWENGQKVVEDVKSPITRKNPVYTLKKQLFLLHYGKTVEFRET